MSGFSQIASLVHALDRSTSRSLLLLHTPATSSHCRQLSRPQPELQASMVASARSPEVNYGRCYSKSELCNRFSYLLVLKFSILKGRMGPNISKKLRMVCSYYCYIAKNLAFCWYCNYITNTFICIKNFSWY